MARFILNYFLSYIIIGALSSQDNLHCLRQNEYTCSQVFLDVFNNLYCYDVTHKSITKYNAKAEYVARTSIAEINPPFTVDLSDPFKISINSPHSGESFVFTENLSLFSINKNFSHYSQYAIIQYTTDIKCELYNNQIILTNVTNNQVQKSVELFVDQVEGSDYPSQIKTDGDHIYLLIPGSGFWYLNSFLNVELEILDKEIIQIELVNNTLFYLKNGIVYRWTIGKEPAAAITEKSCESFTVNSDWLMCITQGLLSCRSDHND